MSAYLDEDLRACTPMHARYVIAGIDLPGVIGTTVTMPVWLDFIGECVHLISLPRHGSMVSYYDLRMVTVYTPTAMAICGAALAGNFRAGLDTHNHRDYYTPRVELTPPRVRLGELLALIENTKHLPVSRITQDHHMYITRREVRVAYESSPKSGGR